MRVGASCLTPGLVCPHRQCNGHPTSATVRPLQGAPFFSRLDFVPDWQVQRAAGTSGEADANVARPLMAIYDMPTSRGVVGMSECSCQAAIQNGCPTSDRAAIQRLTRYQTSPGDETAKMSECF